MALRGIKYNISAACVCLITDMKSIDLGAIVCMLFIEVIDEIGGNVLCSMRYKVTAHIPPQTVLLRYLLLLLSYVQECCYTQYVCSRDMWSHRKCSQAAALVAQRACSPICCTPCLCATLVGTL